MILLPRVSPEDFYARFQAFDDAAKYLEMSPADRWLAWCEYTQDANFSEWPVPIEHFVSDPFYIGTEAAVRPKIKEFMQDFCSPHNVFEVFIFVGGLGSGKSYSASILLMYSLYQLSCLRRPLRYLSTFPGVQMDPSSEIACINASGAGARQSAKVVYAEASTKIQASPFFRRPENAPYEGKFSELEFPNRVRFSPGSGQARSVLGFNVFAFVVDEAAFGTENMETDTDSVRDLFLALNQRRRSRFGHMGWGGLFTSPQSEGAFVETLAGDGGVAGSDVLVRRITTWEAKDELQPGTPVFLLDRNPDAVRLVRHDLIYVAPGVAITKEGGDLVRFGAPLPSELDARRAVAEWRHREHGCAHAG